MEFLVVARHGNYYRWLVGVVIRIDAVLHKLLLCGCYLILAPKEYIYPLYTGCVVLDFSAEHSCVTWLVHYMFN